MRRPVAYLCVGLLILTAGRFPQKTVVLAQSQTQDADVFLSCSGPASISGGASGSISGALATINFILQCSDTMRTDSVHITMPGVTSWSVTLTLSTVDGPSCASASGTSFPAHVQCNDGQRPPHYLDLELAIR